MTRGILHQWSYLALHNDMIKKPDAIEQQIHKIIEQFENSLLKTEKLHSKDYNLFAMRLNDKARAVCTTTKYNNEECLVILEILPNHEYDKSKYLNSKAFKLSINNITIFASTIETQQEVSVKRSLMTLPKIYTTEINNKLLILGKDQVQILEEEVVQPTVFKISGYAGSGKTTLAELLMAKAHAAGSKVLYVTKSIGLVSRAQSQYEIETDPSLNLPKIIFSTYQALCGQLIYDKLFSEGNLNRFKQSTGCQRAPIYQEVLDALNKNSTEADTRLSSYLKKQLYGLDNFMQWVQGQHVFKQYAGNEKLRIGREIYEDIHKLNDKTPEGNNSTIGKKESYGHNISQEILSLYKKHLEKSKSLDLSLVDLSSVDHLERDQFDYIMVDESQDLRKQELNYIKSHLNNQGSIYYLMDSNQSLSDDFNLTSQYILDIATSSTVHLKQYKLLHAYRTPDNITELASKILQIKNLMIGGVLSKEESSITDSLDNFNSLGYIEWIDLSEQQEAIENISLKSLRDEGQQSISLAIIIPDNSKLPEAQKIFPDSMIFTTEEIKGLEFSKVVLYNFFSSKYQANYLNEKRTDLPNLNPDQDGTNQNFPKDAVKAKEMGRHSELFNKLFVALTRTTHDLYFIETKKTKASDYFNKLIQPYANKAEALALEKSSIEDIIEFIEDNCDKLDEEKLLGFCQKAYNAIIEKYFDFSGASALPKHQVENGDPSEYLKKITKIITSRGNTTTKLKNFLENIESLLNSVQSHEENNDNKDNLIGTQVEKASTTEIKTAAKTTSDTSMGGSNSSSGSSKFPRKNRVNKTAKVTTKKIYTLRDIYTSEFDINNLDSLEQDSQGKSILPFLINVSTLKSKLEATINGDQGKSFIKKISAKALQSTDQHGYSALHLLTKKLTMPALSTMLKTRSFFTKISTSVLYKIGPDGWSPLYYILSQGRLEDNLPLKQYIKIISKSLPNLQTPTIEKLLNFSRENVNKCIANQDTALHLNAFAGELEIIEFLVRYGAIIDQKSGKNQTPLHVAASRGHIKIVKYFLQNGADVNAVDNQQKTPLHLAAERGNIDVVKCLLELGAKIEAVTNMKATPLHLAAELGNIEIVECLVNKGAKIEAVADGGRTPLHLAAERGNIDVVKCLLKLGAKIDAVVDGGSTPLHLATQMGNIDVVKCLLKLGAKIDAVTNMKATPLHIAAVSLLK